MNEAVKLKRAARKGDKIFKQIRKIISTDPKLTETQRTEKLHKINQCQYIIKTALLVADGMSESPQKAMGIMLNRVYLMKTETLN